MTPDKPGDATEESKWLRRELVARGIIVTPRLIPGTVNRYEELASTVDECDLFIVFGTKTYGEKTPNPMCTWFEFSQALNAQKRMAWVNMCAWPERVECLFVRTRLEGLGAIYRPFAKTDAFVDWMVNDMLGSAVAAAGGGMAAAAGGGAAQ
jgi:hypothetical protein